MRKLVITVVITFLAFIGALPQTNADDSQSEKTRYWKPTQGDCCGENCNVVYSYYGDSLPKIGINQEFSYFEFIQYASNDGALSASCCSGLTINSNPFTSYASGVFDHAKYFIFTNQAFTMPSHGEISFSGKLSMEAFKVNDHPFGAQVQDPQSDFRLAAAAFNVLSFNNGLIFDFFITNTKIYALYERIDTLRVPFGNYAAFTFAIPVADTLPNETHLYTISFNADEKSVRWLVDGKEVYKLYMIGTLVSRQFMSLDLGGQEEMLFPTELRIGFGTFTLVDGYSPCNVLTPALDGGKICQFPANEQGLTRLTVPGAQLNPRNGVDPATFLTDGTQAVDHIWGQGVVMQLEKIFVSVC